MDRPQPTGIHLHLTSGQTHVFYQEDALVVARICDDISGRVFARPSLVVDSPDCVTAFPGRAIVGITVVTDPLPDSFYKQERASGAVISQIDQQSFALSRSQHVLKREGHRSLSVCEVEFVSGGHLFVELNEIRTGGMGERALMHHMFTHPSLWCRRLAGGFSIWNTAHIVAWSHYPKLEVPANAWQAVSLAEPLSPPRSAYPL